MKTILIPSRVRKAVGKILTVANLVFAGLMFAVSPARGEAVLNQIGGASDFTGAPISASANFSITWTAAYAGQFESVKFRIYNTSLVSPITALSLKFSLADDAGTSVTGTNTYNNGAVNNISDYLFDLSGAGLGFSSGQSGQLYFRLNAAQSSGGTVNWSTTNRGVEAYAGWTGGLTPGVGNGQFELSAVAIPEPMTSGYLAGATVLVCAWASRRNRRR